MSNTFKQIDEAVIKSKGVANLATRPNMPSRYGEGNLTADQLKKRFDDLAIEVITKYNEMARILSSQDALKYLKLPDGVTLSGTTEQTVKSWLDKIIDVNGNLVAIDPSDDNVIKTLDSVLTSLYAAYSSAYAHADTAKEKAEEAMALGEKLRDIELPKKQDNLSFDGIYNSETNKAATVQTVIDKVAELIAGAPEDFNTLKELTDWLTSHEGSAAEMNSAIEQNAKDIVELSEKVNSLPDEITFEGLPDKPFDGTARIDLSIVTNKGKVALNSGRKAYFQTDKTYTVDEMIGATVRYQNDSNTATYTLAQGNIVHESADGITVKVVDEYIIVAYTTNYIPTDKTTQLSSSPLPYVGVYFTEDSSGDYYIISLSKAATATKRLDGEFIKLYKHTVFINATYDSYGESAAKIHVSFLSTSSKPITTLQELEKSPACANGYLQCNYPRHQYYPMPAGSLEGMRDVHSVTISNGILKVEFITAYTIPATTMVHSFGPGISPFFSMRDTVTEV